MTLNAVMGVFLRYFSDFGSVKVVEDIPKLSETEI